MAGLILYLVVSNVVVVVAADDDGVSLSLLFSEEMFADASLQLSVEISLLDVVDANGIVGMVGRQRTIPSRRGSNNRSA